MRGVGKPPWWSLDTVVVTGWMNGWDLEVSSDVLGCRKSVTLNWQLTAAVRRTDLKLGSLNMIGLGKSCHNPSGLTGGVNTSSQLIMRANIKLWFFLFLWFILFAGGKKLLCQQFDRHRWCEAALLGCRIVFVVMLQRLNFLLTSTRETLWKLSLDLLLVFCTAGFC